MERLAGYWFSRRPAALLALAIPGFAGIGYLLAFNAPVRMVAINAASLLVGLVLVAFARPVRSKASRRIASGACLAMLAAPLVLGPEIGSIARWIAVGGFTLHAGMLVIPLFCSLVALDKEDAPTWMLIALLVAFAQPDVASCLALACASARLAIAELDWKQAALAVLGVAASIGASFNGELPPQPYVEGVLETVWQASPLGSAAMFLTLAASYLAILYADRAARSMRYALSGVMLGFILAAMLGPYPYPLIGYGAASIIGLALALSFGRIPPAPVVEHSCPDANSPALFP